MRRLTIRSWTCWRVENLNTGWYKFISREHHPAIVAVLKNHSHHTGLVPCDAYDLAKYKRLRSCSNKIRSSIRHLFLKVWPFHKVVQPFLVCRVVKHLLPLLLGKQA